MFKNNKTCMFDGQKMKLLILMVKNNKTREFDGQKFSYKSKRK